MDIKTLEEMLIAIDIEIDNLLELNGYKRDHRLDMVIYDKDDANDCMLYEEFGTIFRHLDYVNSMLIYLQKSVKREGVICFAQNGKYKLNEVELDIGDVIEILIFSEDTETYRWKPIMIKGDVDLEGKAARMRA